MMAWLLDTNILSEIRRLKPEPKVLTFIAARPLDELYISAVTLAELRFGIERLDAGNRREELNRWLTHTRGRIVSPRPPERGQPIRRLAISSRCLSRSAGPS